MTGQEWKERRKLMTKPFSAEVVQTMIPKIVNYAQKLALDLLSRNNSVAVRSIIYDHVFMNLLETSFGLEEGSQWSGAPILKTKLQKWVENQTNRVGNPMLWFGFINRIFLILKGQRSDNEIMMSLMSNLIEIRLQERKAGSFESSSSQPFLTHLINSFLIESDGISKKVDTSEIIHEMLSTTINSMDTTVSAITWTLFCLASHPEIQERLYHELDSFHPGDVDMNLAEINSFMLLDQCIKESLRLYPSAGFLTRAIDEDLELDGYVVPKNAQVLIPVFLVHRDEHVYPSPETFDPNRFLPENEAKIPQGSYLPFGFGLRSCVAKMTGLTVIKIFTAHIVKNCELTLSNPESIHPIRFDLLPIPNRPIELQIRSRSPHPNWM